MVFVLLTLGSVLLLLWRTRAHLRFQDGPQTVMRLKFGVMAYQLLMVI